MEKNNVDEILNLEMGSCQDSAFCRVQSALLVYLFHLKGRSSREISDMDDLVPSHNTIAKSIKQGRIYFRGLFLIFKKIQRVIKEKRKLIEECPFIGKILEENPSLFNSMVKKGNIRLNINEKERESLIKDFEGNSKMQKALPKLYFKLKQGDD